MQQSELALFAREFLQALGPLRREIAGAAGRIEAELAPARGARPTDGTPLPALEELRAGVGAVARELAALAERVELERASVLVFGPTKAGKSTLLDALAGARVSEVSILPGYPSVLRARHARSEGAALQRFDGAREPLEDLGSLRLVLQRAHQDLVAEVRARRARGEPFDPARHLRSAVRRVERGQPAAPLEHAALEVVECPPIHAPLFPTYAEMLIGEPDHARAGVFVVRAAQLADDTVFDGIEELLSAFERLLLVVNLDERSRELSCAGELAASTEREDPARLVGAFEELSTSGLLAEAVRAGRVPVLALDLLEAARARLQGEEEAPSAARPRTRFADLERELFAVLDAHPAFRALVQSALRRALELVEELRELTGASGLAELSPRRDRVAEERATLETILRALERLALRERAQWETEELFDGLRARLASASLQRARELAQELEAQFASAIEDWFAGGTSLQELLRTGLEPRLATAAAELARWAERTLRAEVKAVGPASPLGAATRADLGEARASLTELLAPCAERLRASPQPVALRALDVESIPVRPKLGQRLIGRDGARVRRALFGPPEAPALPLSSADKARRLGDEARKAMQRSAAERAAAILSEEARLSARVLTESLLSAFQKELAQFVATERARLATPVRTLEERQAELEALVAGVFALAPAAERARAALAELGERFLPGETRSPAARAESDELRPASPPRSTARAVPRGAASRGALAEP